MMVPTKFNYSNIFIVYAAFTFAYNRTCKKVCTTQNCKTIMKRLKPIHDHQLWLAKLVTDHEAVSAATNPWAVEEIRKTLQVKLPP